MRTKIRLQLTPRKSNIVLGSLEERLSIAQTKLWFHFQEPCQKLPAPQISISPIPAINLSGQKFEPILCKNLSGFLCSLVLGVVKF
jgi:hypothetical protein